jgi:hypothetical protein
VGMQGGARLDEAGPRALWPMAGAGGRHWAHIRPRRIRMGEAARPSQATPRLNFTRASCSVRPVRHINHGLRSKLYGSRFCPVIAPVVCFPSLRVARLSTLYAETFTCHLTLCFLLLSPQTSKELKKLLKSIGWDLIDLDETVDVVEENPAKFNVSSRARSVVLCPCPSFPLSAPYAWQPCIFP